MKKYRYIVVVRAPKGDTYAVANPNGVSSRHNRVLCNPVYLDRDFLTRAEALAFAEARRATFPSFTYKVFHVQKVRRQK